MNSKLIAIRPVLIPPVERVLLPRSATFPSEIVEVLPNNTSAAERVPGTVYKITSVMFFVVFSFLGSVCKSESELRGGEGKSFRSWR